MSKSQWCPKCHREYVRKGVECNVCTYRYSELKATLVVMGVMALLLSPGIIFVYALFSKLGI
jgi:hypothetical protein